MNNPFEHQEITKRSNARKEQFWWKI